ncbi:DUF3291 domain-containing protein [Marinobacter arenosus]|uniref:DUF3291 domain-containing protein n=1 Tax=Marinobacter arenosus TaxID=2856822 RepID=UPI001C4C0198|nr:DUF3291 domain-containing protein [Marinobacter arenosus]MBW0148952.1 DUF3291 domain-containing protein [Marinobacter arenosus]
MSQYHIAQLNIAKLKAPIDSPQLADFVANLDRINALADDAAGFVWRLQTEDGDATGIDYFGSDQIVNLSLWESVEALHDYVYRSVHVEIMRRKKEWFHKMADSHMVLWWVPAGHLPSIEEASAQLELLRELGPTQEAFTFKKAFPAPNESASAPSDSWGSECPAV